MPVPIDWFESLADDLRKVLEAEHRPVKGNPYGLMDNATVEFGRSIGKDQANQLIKVLNKDLVNPSK